jgi:hypothetical protein
MMYDDVVRDFAERTRKNLSAIERLGSAGDEVYEVTQLVNSMLGLLVFPREEFVNEIPELALGDLEADGWQVPRVVGELPQAANLRELVRYLRNAIAHFNVRFVGDGSQVITVLRLCNTEPRRNRRTWEADLGVEELRAIAEPFVDLLLGERPLKRGTEQ